MVTVVTRQVVDDGALLGEQARVLKMIVRGEPLSEVLAALCRIVEDGSGRSVRADILLVDDEGTKLRTGAAPSLPAAYNAAIDGVEISPDIGTCSAAAARRETVVTQDIESDPSWSAFKHLPLELGLVAVWSMPIISSEQRLLGTFGTYFTENREPRPYERRLVEVLSRTAALAIERERSDRRLRDHSERQRFIAELHAATQILSDPDELMATTARMLAEYLGADRCAYAEVIDDRVFDVTGDHSRGVPSLVGTWEMAAFGAACVQHMHDGMPYVVNDADTDPRISAADLPAYRATVIRATVCVPLHKAGKLSAVMAVHQKVPRHWSEQEIDIITTVVASCWEALERARVARDLRESEARYRAIVEATPECVKVVARDGTLLQINAAGLGMIEVESENDVLGRSAYDLVVPEHRVCYREHNQRVCSGIAGTLLFDIVGMRGTRRTMESASVPLVAPSGQYVQLSVTRDVTARVATARALAENRARLDYAVRLSGVGFWYCDLPFGTQLMWDDRVKEQFFLPADAEIGIETWFERMHSDDREPMRQAMQTSIDGRTPFDVEYRIIDPTTGDTRWLRALGGATYAADGSPIRFDGVSVDITAQKHVEDELRQQDRRKDEFLATLAHELRNPLAPIRTGLQLLRVDVRPEMRARTEGMMERQLDHLVHMVDDLLDISRVTLGKVTLRKERVDLRAVLDSALETSRPVVEAGGHELAVRLPKAALPLDVDPTRIAQVFANLVNNAAKYTPPGGRIVVAVEAKQRRVELRVTDNGDGIPPDMVPRVFDMFTQVGRSIDRSHGGLGIGLTLVRRLLDMHGGSVSAESPGVGQGSTFTVTLPLAAANETDVRSVAPLARGPGGLRVMIVDDNIDAAETLGIVLEISGNQTRVAHTGPDALDAIASFRPHVVLLDIGLPGLNGYEVARRLRANSDLPQPMLIALTGWGSEDDRRQARDAGFDRHLVKPVDSATLAATLADVRPAFE
jgi:PAS domain S-box-containing protein